MSAVHPARPTCFQILHFILFVAARHLLAEVFYLNKKKHQDLLTRIWRKKILFPGDLTEHKKKQKKTLTICINVCPLMSGLQSPVSTISNLSEMPHLSKLDHTSERRRTHVSAELETRRAQLEMVFELEQKNVCTVGS